MDAVVGAYQVHVKLLYCSLARWASLNDRLMKTSKMNIFMLSPDSRCSRPFGFAFSFVVHGPLMAMLLVTLVTTTKEERQQ